MKIIMIPSIITLLLLIVESCIRKVKHDPIYYIRIFTIMLGTYLFLDSLHADEYKFVPSSKIEISMYKDSIALSPRHFNYMKEKIEYHREEGRKCFNKAQEISLLIPNLSDRELAKQLFASAIFTSANGVKSFSSIVLGLSILLIEYSFCVYDQWNEIQFNLKNSEYHYEMMEFYTKTLQDA